MPGSQRESATHVAAATDGVEFGLRLGGAQPLQHVVAQAAAQPARQRPGQLQRLVVAALAQAACDAAAR